MPEQEYPMTILMGDVRKAINKYMVVFRNKTKCPAMVIDVNEKENLFSYEVLGGTDKGGQFEGKYDPKQKAIVYDEGSKVIALLDS